MDRSLTVLIADDEDLVRRRVSMMLGDRFCVDQAETARAAREAALRDYDAIMLDIMFPDGNGIEICKEIKTSKPHSTVVISSSMESVDAWNEAFQAGADGYLEKRELLVLDPKKLVLMIENLVERNRLRRAAEELNARQARLLSILSHDVRAPFQALLGTIELLKKSNELPDAAAANIETLHQCAKDQLSFINSLLELLRLESGLVPLRLTPVDINLPIHQAVQSLRILADRKGIRLVTLLGKDLSPINGDLGRLCQLVSNLVANAIKFTPRGGNVQVTTEAQQRDGRDGVELRVSDTGIGIRPEEMAKLFQRFHRGRETGTDGEKGTGLGLSICKEIVQLHEGSLSIDSDLQAGTLVKVWLPARDSTLTAVSRIAACQKQTADSRPARC